MPNFNLKIVTPDKEIFNNKCLKAIVRTEHGDIGILSGHVNYLSMIDIGFIKIFLINGDIEIIAVSNGIINIGFEETVIMVFTGESKKDIDISRAKNAIKKAEKIISSSNKNSDILMAELKLKRALNRVDIYNK